MTYDPTIPKGTQSPANSQAAFQTNFAQYATIFAKNHSALNSSHQGDHEAVIFEKQTSDPGVTEDLAALYCKDATSALGTTLQIFAQIKKFLPTGLDTTVAPNTPMQLTYGSVNTAGPVFQSFLPGGFLFYCGSGSAATSPVTVTLLPAGTKILVAIAIPTDVTTSGTPVPIKYSVNVLNSTQFNIYFDFSAHPANIPYNWMAIASV